MPDERVVVECPCCGGKVKDSGPGALPFFPFCSRRCKLIDLGKWFDGQHRIETPLDSARQEPPPQEN